MWKIQPTDNLSMAYLAGPNLLLLAPILPKCPFARSPTCYAGEVDGRRGKVMPPTVTRPSNPKQASALHAVATKALHAAHSRATTP